MSPIVALSHNQVSLLYEHGLDPESSAYNTGFAGKLVADPDTDALARAVTRLQERHPMLRAVVNQDGPEPRQRILDAAPVILRRVDASQWSEETLKRRVAREYRQPYRVAEEPSFRAVLFWRAHAPGEHVLLLGSHHLSNDRRSFELLITELEQLYDAELGHTAALPTPAATYVDFIQWQADELAGDMGAHWQRFWTEQLADAPTSLPLPIDLPRPAIRTYSGAVRSFTIPEPLSGRVRELARRERCTMFRFLLAAFDLLLLLETGQQEILVGTPMLGRPSRRYDGVVGHFVNMLPIRARMPPDVPFLTFLASVNDTVFGAIVHQHYPFARMVRDVHGQRGHAQHGRGPRDPARSPLFQVAFHVNGPWAPFRGPRDGERTKLWREPFPLTQHEGQFELSLELVDRGDRLDGALAYDTELFRESTAARLCQAFVSILQHVTTTPDAPLARIADAARPRS